MKEIESVRKQHEIITKEKSQKTNETFRACFLTLARLDIH